MCRCTRLPLRLGHIVSTVVAALWHSDCLPPKLVPCLYFSSDLVSCSLALAKACDSVCTAGETNFQP